MNRIMSFGVALGIVLAGTAGRAEATEYIFTLIDYPGAGGTWTTGITDSGQIVGEYYVGSRSRGFTLNGSVYTSFNHPAASTAGSGALGINNSGQIVGWYDTAGTNTYGAYLRDGAEYHALTPFGSSMAFAEGINDSANVVGYYRDAGGVDRGFLFDGTSYTTIDAPDAATTYAFGINNAGVIVGAGFPEGAVNPFAFIREVDGTYTEFQVSGSDADATEINDSGQIVGRYGPTIDDHYGFVLSGGVGSTPDTLHVPGATITEAWDINNLGHVVGRYTSGTYYEGPWRGFLATPIPDVPGDYNCNGVVDAADYIVWRDTLGSTFDMRANGDNSGASAHVIDTADYAMWRAHFGETAGVPGVTGSAYAGVVIPEPASLLLAVLAATWLLAGLPAATKPRC